MLSVFKSHVLVLEQECRFRGVRVLCNGGDMSAKSLGLALWLCYSNTTLSVAEG